MFRTAKSILKLLQNKVIASLMLLGQGVLFLASPSGDMKPTIRISAGLIILVALIMLFLHLRHPQKRNVLDIVIAVFNGLLIPAAIYCLISPEHRSSIFSSEYALVLSMSTEMRQSPKVKIIGLLPCRLHDQL